MNRNHPPSEDGLPRGNWAIDHCPGNDEFQFALDSDHIVRVHYVVGPPLPQMELNKELAKIRDVLNGLSMETEDYLRGQEMWELVKGVKDQAGKSDINVSMGVPAFDKLKLLVAKDAKYPVRSNAMPRYDLINAATGVFTNHGGEITAGAASPFGLYLADLLTECGMEDVTIPDAIRAFMARIEDN
jgi:hypothetical protein